MDNSSLSRASVLGFGVFQLDCQAGELRKSGVLIHLPPQPFKVLYLLVSHPGQVVTREDIRQQIWGDETYVDFEQGLNHCVRQIRTALGDEADTPRYIETLPRRGYRFIYPVVAASVAAKSLSETAIPDGQGSVEAASARRREGSAHAYKFVALAAAVVVLIVAAVMALKVAGVRNRLLGRATAPPIIHSIAVLPLENLSRDPSQEYFADGMTEELITTLGKINALRVISRTSVMRYKEPRKPLAEIAHELHVDAVLEGAVLRSRDQVRITAQLVRINPERQVWAESYERDVRDVLALQKDVALAIAHQVQAELTPRERAQMATQPPVNPQAYTAYLKGRYEMAKDNEQGYKKAAEYFQQAVELQPDYALAYAGLGHACSALGNAEFLSPQEAYPKARAATQRALEIDGTLAGAHFRLGWIKFRYDWDWSGADAEFRRAIELNPTRYHQGYSIFLGLMGRYAEAIAEARRAEEIDPLSVYDQPGNVFYHMHQFDRAIEQLQRTVAIFGADPNSGWAHCLLARAYTGKHMFKEAIEEQQKAIMLLGDSPLYLGMLGDMYGAAGKKTEALKILNQLNKRSKRKYVSPYDIALIYIGLGEKDQAFVWLEKAYRARSNDMASLRVDPMFDSVRSDPRFQAILSRMNFPPQSGNAKP